MYYDAIASVFLARSRRDLETAFPSVDFTARHFRDPARRAIPPEPWGLSEAWGLHNVGLILRHRSAAAPVSASPLQLPLALLVCDRVRDALALDSANVSHWCLLGDSAWNLVARPKAECHPIPASPGNPCAGFCRRRQFSVYRRALAINPRDSNALRSLSDAFQVLGLSDAQRSLDAQVPSAGQGDQPTSGGDAIGATDQRRPRPEIQDEPLTDRQGDGADGLSRAGSNLLRQARAEAATPLLAEAENRGIGDPWLTCDRVATTLMYLGRPAEARRVWERATDPPSPALRLAHIAASELAELNFPAAEHTYQAARALDPGLGETWLGLALLYTQRGDPAEALMASREGLRRARTPEQRHFLRFIEALASPLCAATLSQRASLLATATLRSGSRRRCGADRRAPAWVS